MSMDGVVVQLVDRFMKRKSSWCHGPSFAGMTFGPCVKSFQSADRYPCGWCYGSITAVHVSDKAIKTSQSFPDEVPVRV